MMVITEREPVQVASRDELTAADLEGVVGEWRKKGEGEQRDTVRRNRLVLGQETEKSSSYRRRSGWQTWAAWRHRRSS